MREPFDKAIRDDNTVQQELVQVAAVACAILEDIQFGKTYCNLAAGDSLLTQGRTILEKVIEERRAQDHKWGTQHHNMAEWTMILLEEFGELIEAIYLHWGLSSYLEDFHDIQIIEPVLDAGWAARKWLENHEWPERQQKVYDKEKRASVGSGAGGGGSPTSAESGTDN